jgi:hypothetical protein
MARTIQKVRLFNKVLKMFSSVASLVSTNLQLIELNIFIKMKVWKIIVSSSNLDVGEPSSLGFGSVIRLNVSSKKIKTPKYMRKRIATILYAD